MKDISLDVDSQSFEKILNRAAKLVADTHHNLENKPVFNKKTPAQVLAPFQECLPQEAMDQEKLWDLMESQVIGNATLNSGPNFYSYVLSPGNQMGLAGELISGFLNQNASKWHLGPAASEMEKVVIGWIRDFIGYHPDSGGILVSGGSMANLTCLTVARNQQARVDINHKGLYSNKPLMLYMTDQAHYCVDKAMAILGLGKEQIRRVACDQQLRMDYKVLQDMIERDLQSGLQPFCVVGSAGTVNTGAVDAMERLADLCDQYGLWFHIDAAYGGPAAGLEAYKELFQGLDRADSLALDPHKWLYVPLEAGCALFKDPEQLKETFSLVPDYLKVDRDADVGRTDFMEYGPQLTRSFRALKIWVTFKAYGARRLKENILNDINKVQYLDQKLQENSQFEILSPAQLSILCFRWNPEPGTFTETQLDAMNVQLLHALEKDGRVFITGTRIKGKIALRVCIVNHRTQQRHLDKLVSILDTLTEEISVAG